MKFAYMTGVRKPTNRLTKFLLIESGQSTINKRRRFLLINYLTKIEANSSHTLHNWLRNPSMYRGIAKYNINTQKKFPVPLRSIAHKFPLTPLQGVGQFHNKYLFLKMDKRTYPHCLYPEKNCRA